MTVRGLKLSLSFDRARYKSSDRQMLNYKLTNTSSRSINILMWHTPFEGFRNDIFSVEKDGKPILYVGPLFKRGTPTRDDYLTIEPKESASVDVDLSEAYEIIDAGRYLVESKSNLFDVVFDDRIERLTADETIPLGNLRPQIIISNVASFELSESRAPKQRESVDLGRFEGAEMRDMISPRLTLAFRNATADQQKTVRMAFLEAMRMSQEARVALIGILDNEMHKSSRFSNWFGNYDKGLVDYMARYQKLIDNFTKMFEALLNKQITFNCGDCPKKMDNAYAWVNPMEPYIINLCKVFWKAPPIGTDSKAGTILHELSHFYVVAGTEDNTYFQKECQDLAKSDPAKAIANADSHEYFAENDPLLVMRTNASIAASLKSHISPYIQAPQGGGGIINARGDHMLEWETFVLIDLTSSKLTSGDIVHLKTYNGVNYVVAEGGGGGEVKADRVLPAGWESFVISKIGGSGEIKYGDSISLKVYNGNYLQAAGGGGGAVNAAGPAVKDWETFKIFSSALAKTYKVNLRAFNGLYVAAENGGGGALNANRKDAQEFGTFNLIDISKGQLTSGDSIHLMTWNGVSFIRSDGGGGSTATAASPHPVEWETFVINRVDGAGIIKDGDKISFQTYNKKNYLQAAGGGGGAVNAAGPAVKEWETFTIEFP